MYNGRHLEPNTGGAKTEYIAPPPDNTGGIFIVKPTRSEVRRLSIVVLGLLFSTFAAVVSPASDDGVNMAGITHRETQDFLESLQAALQAEDRKRVTALVWFPVRVDLDGEFTTVDDVDRFLQLYDRIFTRELIDVILAEQYEELFINSKGVSIGTGAVWFAGLCEDESCDQHVVRIITINGVNRGDT
jgi:hypothetical protein